MSENEYQLYAWTENEEVRFSGLALREQEALLMDEYDSLYYSDDISWERYERLSRVAWQWGMLLFREKDYWAAYARFRDGVDICREAIRECPVPKDGGVHPFLPALDELYRGCEDAAWAEGSSLWLFFCEDALQDIRQGLWGKAPVFVL